MINESVVKIQKLVDKTNNLSNDIDSEDYITIRDAIRKMSIVNDLYKEKREIDKDKLSNKERRRLKFIKKFSKIKKNYSIFIKISTIPLLVLSIILTVVNPMLFPTIIFSLSYPFISKLVYNNMLKKAKEGEEVKNKMLKYTALDMNMNTNLMHILEILNQKVYVYVEKENIKTDSKNIMFDYLCSKSETAIKDYLNKDVKSVEFNDYLFKEVTKSILQEKLNSGVEDVDKLLQSYKYFTESRKRIRK